MKIGHTLIHLLGVLSTHICEFLFYIKPNPSHSYICIQYKDQYKEWLVIQLYFHVKKSDSTPTLQQLKSVHQLEQPNI